MGADYKLYLLDIPALNVRKSISYISRLTQTLQVTWSILVQLLHVCHISCSFRLSFGCHSLLVYTNIQLSRTF